MRRLIFLAVFLFTTPLYAEPYTKVQLEPLSTRMSVSTVTTNTVVVTLPTVELVGRKEICIVNMDTSQMAYISSSSSSTVGYGFPLYPRQSISIRVDNTIHLFATANTATVNLRTMEVK